MLSFRIRQDNDPAIEPQYFTLKELCYTSVKCVNYPLSFTIIANLRALADFLDDVRQELGRPIFVNSGYRCQEVNNAVGGVSRSLHLQGRAADIWCSDDCLDKLIEILRQHRNQMSEFIVNKEKHYIHIAI